jgi:hypothetical protein
LQGWDIETGLQKRSTLEEIGLPEVIEKLEPRGLIR